jgi:hypothetical protein
MAEQALTVPSGRSVGVPPLSPERLAGRAWLRQDAEARSDSKLYVSANHHFHFRIYRLDCVDIHLVQINALTRHRMDRNALGVWS